MGYSMNCGAVPVWTILFVLVTMEAVQGCTLQNGISYIGADMSYIGPEYESVIAVSRESCGLLCLSKVGCAGYTFYPLTGNCTFKSNFENVVVDPKALSGIVTGQCDFIEGFEFPLFSSNAMGTPNKEECCRWCSQFTKCAGFTYFKSGPKSGNCELKYATSNRVASPNMVSGALSGTSSCVFEEGVDYRGFDQKNVTNVASKMDCCAKCRSTTNCKAFSYVNSGAGAKTCVLKTNSVNRVTNKDAISSVAKGVTCSQQSLSSTTGPNPPSPRTV